MQQQIAVYVHWPFCISKCPYCDFNSHVAGELNTDSFIEAYAKELEYFRPVLEGRIITSVYFGGGTPSLAPPRFFALVLRKLQELAAFAPDIEITMEANPSSVEVEKFAAIRTTGVNRLSLGIQSLNDAELQFLGRAHDSKEAYAALEAVAKTFDRYSFDLMYALPGQSTKSWNAALQHALQFTGGHLSMYQLTIEKGTRFYTDYVQGKFTLPEPELAADLYDMTTQVAAQHHMHAYEVSNYANLGQESRHNLTYWRYGDYIGIGAGAHGRYTYAEQKHATVMWHNPQKWATTVHTTGVALQQQEIIDTETQYTEMVMMGMRLSEGLPKAVLRWHDAVDQLITDELLTLEPIEGYIRTTNRGRLLLNYVLQQILASD